ncbi:MAG TPA: hypothetical protein VF071_10970 [Candidatus Limnocylindria bacterium]
MEQSGAILDAEKRLAVERWFVRRGVPQLVEGYESETRLDTRAAPLIVAWLVIGTVLFWGVNPAWSLAANAAGVAATLVAIPAVFIAVRALRRRPPVARTVTFDPYEIVLLGLAPGIAAGLIDGSVREAIVAFLNALLGIGIIYVVILFGVIELGIWALGRLRSQLAGIAGLVATTLPVLLILVAFLLFAAEIWEAGHALGGWELLAVIGLLVVIGALLVVTTFRAELTRMQVSLDWTDVLRHVPGTPVEPLVARVGPVDEHPPLSWLERINLAALVLVNQLIQSAFVALVITGFLVVLGLLAIPAEVQERWIGEPVQTLVRFGLLGEERRLSGELLTVSALLGGIVGLYFTGLAITDAATQRSAEFRRAVSDVRQLLAVRAVYLAALAADAQHQQAPARADEAVAVAGERG